MLVSDFKKANISFTQLEIAAMNNYSLFFADDEIIDFTITSARIYRIPKTMKKYFLNFCKTDRHFYHHIYVKNFLSWDCEEYEGFYEFLADMFKTELSRETSTTRYRESLSFFQNIGKNRRIKEFCRMIDAHKGEMNIFDIYRMYKCVYKKVWNQGKFFIQEMVIYNAALNFFSQYSESQREEIKFYDYLLTEIIRRYVSTDYKLLNVSETFNHNEVLPCPFCGKQPGIYIKELWNRVYVDVSCEDCSILMREPLVQLNGYGNEKVCIPPFVDTINKLIEGWNHRIKNDDMWLDDETLPDELPECEPDMFPEKVYAPGLKPCPFCGSKAALKKRNSCHREGIKTISVVCDKGCFAASHFGTPENVPDKHTIGYMAYRWNQRKILA